VFLSTTAPSPLSKLERDIFFYSLSQLVDEYLIADQKRQAWEWVAIGLDCVDDPTNLRAACETAKRIGGVVAGCTMFDVPYERRKDAARSAAYLVFFHLLNGAHELLDCGNDRCGRRFIFGLGRRDRFCSDGCRTSYNSRLRKERRQHTQNLYRIGIAIGAITTWLLDRKGDWRLAVLNAWSIAEKRESLRAKLDNHSPRRSDRVPKEIGYTLLQELIHAASDENNRALVPELIEKLCGGSATDKEYLECVISTLFRLIREVESIRKRRITANPNTKVIDEDPARVERMAELAGLSEKRSTVANP
jgi:hypothetical protein